MKTNIYIILRKREGQTTRTKNYKIVEYALDIFLRFNFLYLKKKNKCSTVKNKTNITERTNKEQQRQQHIAKKKRKRETEKNKQKTQPKPKRILYKETKRLRSFFFFFSPVPVLCTRTLIKFSTVDTEADNGLHDTPARKLR